MLLKLYQIDHLTAPYRVVLTDPSGKLVHRHFKDEGEAKASLRPFVKRHDRPHG
jgi:hypothetical protein